MKSRIVKITLAVVSMVFLAAGCGGGQPQAKKVTLTIWDPFMETQNLQPLFDAYQKTHSNVSIVYTKENIATYQQDLLNALAAGTGPDIYSINNAWLPQYLDKATPAPASILSIKEYKNAFVDTVAQDFSKDNKIYGVAMSVDSLALYYNKDLLGSAGIATPPKTWDELARDVQKIKRQNSRGYFTLSGVSLGTNANINRAVDIVYLMMLQQGATSFDSQGYPTFANPVNSNGNYINPGLNALNFYTSFASPQSPNYNWNNQSDYSIDAFVNGRSAFLFSYSYTRQTIAQKAPNLNFDVAPVPQPDLDRPAVNFANYWGQVVSKQSQNWQTSWDLLKFMASKSSLDTYYAKTKAASSRRDLIELQIQDPEIGVFANANLTAKPFSRPDQVKVDSIFGRMIDNVILRNYTTEEALSQAQSEASAVTVER